MSQAKPVLCAYDGKHGYVMHIQLAVSNVYTIKLQHIDPPMILPPSFIFVNWKPNLAQTRK